jgi:peptidoglycan/LPS O-acetylase OafA/YrhL
MRTIFAMGVPSSISSNPSASAPESQVGYTSERAERIRSLDALRGLAAATVVLHHCFISFPDFWNDTSRQGLTVLNVFKYSPLHIFFAGDEAVILFFLLSGFVLSLPYWNGVREPYFRWLLRRIARIWIPYAGAVLIATCAVIAVGTGRMHGLSAWFNAVWSAPPTTRVVVGHLILVDQFPDMRLDPVVWSLVHEMRISIVFPLLVAAVALLRWRRALLASILVGGAAFILERKLTGHQSSIQAASTITVLATVQYVPVFVFGIVLARHRETLARGCAGLGRLARWGILAVGVVLYTYPWLSPDAHPSAVHSGAVNRAAVIIGASIFMILALSSERLSRALTRTPLQHLGRISYSLYLYHAIVLLTLFHLFYGHLPSGILIVLVCLCSVVVAECAYRLIERPAIRLGRKLGRRPIAAKTATPTES